jgi:hypothetical protein
MTLRIQSSWCLLTGLREPLPRKSLMHVYTKHHISANYLDRGLTPHLLDISKKGLRAKYMRPIFPVGLKPLKRTLLLKKHALKL